jgi:hypothetical protein
VIPEEARHPKWIVSGSGEPIDGYELHSETDGLKLFKTRKDIPAIAAPIETGVRR